MAVQGHRGNSSPASKVDLRELEEPNNAGTPKPLLDIEDYMPFQNA